MKKHFALLTLLAVAAAITVGCGDSHNPTFTKMPFISNRSSSTPLFVMNLDGSSVTPVADVNTETDIFSPSVSADHKKIAFVSSPNVSVANSDGSSQTQVTSFTDSSADNYSYVYMARISPNGKKIVYGMWNGTTETYDIRIVNVDGSGDTDLTPTLPTGMTGGCYSASFSGDSAKIAFVCYDYTSSTTYGLFQMDADGSHQTPVLSQQGGLNTPMFSSDGKKILVISFSPNSAIRGPVGFTSRNHGHPEGISNTQGIVSVNLDGSDFTVLIPNVYEAEVLNSNIFYTFYDNNLEHYQIYKANLDGTGAVSISDGTSDDYLAVGGGE